jgi:hypothetical protein
MPAAEALPHTACCAAAQRNAPIADTDAFIAKMCRVGRPSSDASIGRAHTLQLSFLYLVQYPHEPCWLLAV